MEVIISEEQQNVKQEFVVINLVMLAKDLRRIKVRRVAAALQLRDVYGSLERLPVFRL